MIVLVACAPAPVVSEAGTTPVGTGTGWAEVTDVPGTHALADGCEGAEPAAGALEHLGFTAPAEDYVAIVDVELDGDVVWAVGQGGLLPVDVTDPSAPAVLFFDRRLVSRLHRVERLPGPYVAATNRNGGLYVFDVTDPTAPSVVDEIRTTGWEGLAAVGDRLYVTVRDGPLQVLDISDPADLEGVGATDGLAAPWEVVDAGDGWLYVADATLGIVPIDISTPDAPVFAEPVPVPSPYHLVAGGSYLYAAVGADGVVVLDRTDPAAPVSVASLSTGGSAISVALDGETLYVADHEGLQAFDVGDPTSPVPLAREEAREYAMAVAASGGQVYLGDWSRFEVWHLDATLRAPAIDVTAEELILDEGAAVTTVYNRGAADLVLLSGGGGSLTVGDTVLAPGQATELVVTEAGAEVCLVSNDPDDPVLVLPTSEGGEAPVGELAPDFTLPALDGSSVQLAEQLGQVVFLTFFATW